MQSRCQQQCSGRHLSDLQKKVDFFRKLGYSPQEVKAALRKLGLGTDTNAVLGELVRSGAKAVPPSSFHSEESLSSGGGGQGSRDDTAEADTDLKPVVIDGSNVAMRWVVCFCFVLACQSYGSISLCSRVV